MYIHLYFVGAEALTGIFTEGALCVHINDLNCTGNELSLWDCPMNDLSSYSCNHYHDSAVVCQCKLFYKFPSLISL